MANSNLPMALTLARIAAGPLVAGLVLWGASETYLDPPQAGLILVCAGALFVLAAITDWLDGYLARSMDAVSPLGAALDHCADKVLITCVLVALAFQSLPLNLIIAAILLLGRDLFVAGLREGLSASGRTLPVGALGKWKAAAAMIGVAALIFEQAAYLDRAPDLIYYATAWTARAGLWAAVALALVSGWDYVAAALRPAPKAASVEPAELDRV
ncbi:MAG TPA: CDP-diacylglycerol--glycerol-3-phosphate 3-phosphatidyltransferase [Caulobacterales bacterium]|nr:CDP-diacylglycerol--glycerol-3-phosphate 3-phosphatidyltransferase [Caulobacterales bacterium]